MPALIYVDANVLINFLEGQPPLIERLGKLFRLADNGKIEVVTSDLSLAEVLVGPLRRKDGRLLETYESLLAPGSAVVLHAIDRSIWVQAALLRAPNPGLRLPDAVHVAMAQHLNCSALLSSDKKLRRLTGVNIPIVNPDVPLELDRLLATLSS